MENELPVWLVQGSLDWHHEMVDPACLESDLTVKKYTSSHSETDSSIQLYSPPAPISGQNWQTADEQSGYIKERYMFLSVIRSRTE